MALPNPRLEARSYAVSSANERFAVKDGCLIERMGAGGSEGGGFGLPASSPRHDADSWRLVFAQAPYEERFEVPAGVRVVGAAAFAKGCPAAARHRCARFSWASGWLGGARDALACRRSDGARPHRRPLRRPRHRFSGCGREPVLVRLRRGDVVAGEGGVAKEVGTAREVGAAAGGGMRTAHLVAGPPAPDSPSRQFSSAGSCPHEGGHGCLGSRGRGECGERDGGAGVRC